MIETLKGSLKNIHRNHSLMNLELLDISHAHWCWTIQKLQAIQNDAKYARMIEIACANTKTYDVKNRR